MFLFLLLAVLCYAGILTAEKITGKQFLRLTKIAGYVIISSMLAIMLMFGLVILF
jgi:hypothetical protein